MASSGLAIADVDGLALLDPPLLQVQSSHGDSSSKKKKKKKKAKRSSKSVADDSDLDVDEQDDKHKSKRSKSLANPMKGVLSHWNPVHEDTIRDLKYIEVDLLSALEQAKLFDSHPVISTCEKIRLQHLTSGGVVVEDYAVIGGQVGIGDKARIESRAVLGSGCGVLTSKVIRAGEVVWGTPARPLKEILEQLANLAKLPEMRAEIAQLKVELALLQSKES